MPHIAKEHPVEQRRLLGREERVCSWPHLVNVVLPKPQKYVE